MRKSLRDFLMDEWVFNQVIVNRKRLREALPDLFDSIEFGKRITDLPLDVLALILSYISLSDVRNCWMVNKQFAEAITKKPHFWKRFIQERLEKETKDWPQLSKCLHLFNNFNSPVPETLEEQMTFLFRKKDWVYIYFADLDTIISIDRRSSMKRVFSTEIRFTDIFYYGSGSYESEFPLFDWCHGEFVCCRKKYTRIYRGGEIERVIGLPHSLGELKWEGKVIEEKDGKIIAHGSGKWISKDGTIFLEGENVAEYGEPVFKLKYEDYKKVKHLITK